MQKIAIGSSILGADQLSRWHLQGYFFVRNKFTPEDITQWQQESDRLWHDFLDPFNVRVETRLHCQGGSVVDRLDPILDISPIFHQLVWSVRLLSLVQEVFQQEAMPFRCKLIRKAPGTCGYLPHQDFPYWEHLGIPADEMLTICVAIDPADSVSGALEVFPGLHHTKLPSDSSSPKDVDPRVLENHSYETAALDAGDLLLFHSLTPHRSSPNISTQKRTVLLPSYVPAKYGRNLSNTYYEWLIARRLSANSKFYFR